MKYNKYIYNDINAEVQTSLFESQSGNDEIHAIINISTSLLSFDEQLACIYDAEERFLNEVKLNSSELVFKRYFLSDVLNQSVKIKTEKNCAVSFIQQPPLNGSKIGLWMYFIKGASIIKQEDTTIVKHNVYTSFWNLGMISPEGDSYNQTRTLLEKYQDTLLNNGATIADNCLRTWFYVRDVDIQYMPMVKARREFFEEIGLTKDTHFIASTGICGIPHNQNAIIQMGAYSEKGLQPGQQEYINALTHLNPTHEYGVTFERATAIHYGDRDHVIISGTASINNKGEVINEGDVKKQTFRMWENVEALLNEAGATYDDVMQIIVYLRDSADYNIVKQLFDNKFNNIPRIITLAPVCRPKWLIEMECVAIVNNNNEYADF